MRSVSSLALLSGLLVLAASHASAQRIDATRTEVSGQSLDAAIVGALRPTHEGMRCAELRSGIRDILWHHRMIMQDPTCRRMAFQSLAN